MSDKLRKHEIENLPGCAVEFINSVVKKMRYRRKVRKEVQAELTAHFEDELRGCSSEEERQRKAQQLIADFGDPKLLAALIRRAKKRCRPAWKKTLVRSFQVLGILFLYLAICFGRLTIGKPTIKVNYVDWLNKLVQAGRDEADNARPYYDKAVKLYVERPQWLMSSTVEWPADFNNVQRLSLISWLEDNRQAFEALRAASQRPYYWSYYQKSGETEFLQGIMENVMQSLTDYRHLAFAVRWRIRYEACNGNIDSALKDCILLQKFGDHLHSKGLLVEQLVGIAIEALAFNEVGMILQKTDVPADALKMVQEELSKQFAKNRPLISIDAEKVFSYDQIQRTFTDNGSGDGRVLVRGLPYAVNNWREGLWGFVSFSYPSRREVVAKIDKYFEQIDEFLCRTPWDLHMEDTDEGKWNETLRRTSLMLKILGPADRRVSQLAWRLETHRNALLTMLAIMRYRKDTNHYPENLNELISAGYLSSLPMDPFSGRPLVYRRIGDGFVFYGVGEDFKDDGGKMGVGEKGRPRMWANNGDWVFWPVQERTMKESQKKRGGSED